MQPEPNGLAGAALALVAIFLPGLLMTAGSLPFWDLLRYTREFPIRDPRHQRGCGRSSACGLLQSCVDERDL